MTTQTVRHLISLADCTRDEIEDILERAAALKSALKAGVGERPLAGRVLAMIFEKPSLRTRVTFETGMFQLGGLAIYLGPENIGLGKRETPADAARNLSRWVDAVVARTYAHGTVAELAANATVPIINGLTDRYHPCQVLADVLTLRERYGDTEDIHVLWVGDGNNVCQSWLVAAARLGIRFTAACPERYHPDPDILAAAQAEAGPGRITVTHDLVGSARDVDVIYTDTWISMGQEAEWEERRVAFAEYQVNETLLGEARSDTVVMHCLPAHRGEEITDAVMDGPQSIVLEQAENRLHAQKGVLTLLLGA